jgi:DNA repair protein RecO (recombination protein O)
VPSNTRLYKTEAIILHQRRVGEADRFLTIYTPGLGKLDGKAKGIRKTTSRMSGHLQPLAHCMLQLAQGHGADVVTGVETMESFQSLTSDLDRLSLGLYAAELTDRMTVDHALRYFELQLLGQSGFRPEIGACVACAKPLDPIDNYFAPVAGGAVCPSCIPGMANTRVLTLNALKLLRLLQRGPYSEVRQVRVDPDLGEEVERHLRSYLICVLERDVNSAAFIERLRKDGLTRVAARSVS